MVMRRIVELYVVLTALLLAAAPQARADDFYKGKVFTVVVGFTPAGGYDHYARNVARYIGNHIPGNPTVIVQNMPGAGSLTAVRYLNMTAPKDGTVMVIFNPGMVTQSIVQPDKVKLDFRDYAWVGVVTPDYRVCYGYGANGPKTWDEMMHRKDSLPSAGRIGRRRVRTGTARAEPFPPASLLHLYAGLLAHGRSLMSHESA